MSVHEPDGSTPPEEPPQDQGQAAAQDGSPTGDQSQDQAPDAWEAVEQLFAQVPHLREGRATVLGTARVGGDVVSGDKHVGLHLHPGSGSSRLRPVGPLPDSELDRVERTFAPTRGYDTACETLAKRQIMVLRGRQGTGRRTAALRMLMQVGRRRSDVIALDPSIEPSDFPDHLRPGAAHIIVDPPTSRESPLRDVHLHAVRRQLVDTGGYFIVAAGPDTVLDEVDAEDWSPPAAVEVVRAHLADHLASMASVNREGANAECARLLELDETVRYLAESPSPQEAAGFARLLASHAVGRTGIEDLAAYGSASAEALADEWFGDRGPGLREKAFLIALAVFDGSPYPLVAELGDALHRYMQAVEEPERPSGRPVFGASRSERLARARAREYAEEAETPYGRIDQRVVAYENSGTWTAVLQHVWMSHPAARDPMVDWLTELAADRRPFVRLRASVAVGVVACADFGHAFDRLIKPWAASPRTMERQLAAWALYTVADGGLESLVRRLLSDWSRWGSQGRKWTAARSYALLGGATSAGALRDIGRMVSGGSAPDGALWATLMQTVEALLQGPTAVEVLARLGMWSESRGELRRLAAQGFLRAARRRHHEPGDFGSWPRLLWVAGKDPAAWQSLVAMWRTVLMDRELRREALRSLASWVRCADVEPAVETALHRLLPGLVVTANDRDRLEYLLRKLREDADRPSHAAERLRAALPAAA